MKFYSEKLNKMFDTEEALVAEEKAVEKAAEEKAAKAKLKKADATKVEEAFKARNQAKRDYNSSVVALRRKFNEDLIKLRATFDKDVAAEKAKVEASEKNYEQELSAFIKKHPEGYHMTIKDGDNVVTIKSNSENDKAADYSNLEKILIGHNQWFNTIFEELFK